MVNEDKMVQGKIDRVKAESWIASYLAMTKYLFAFSAVENLISNI